MKEFRECSCELRVVWNSFICNFQIFQDPTAMMQQLLTTSRQLTLGAYKHETECMFTQNKHRTIRHKYALYISTNMGVGCHFNILSHGKQCTSEQHSQHFSHCHCVHVPTCLCLQSASWSRGLRRKWKQQRKELVRKSQSSKTNSKLVEKPSTTWRLRSGNWRRMETTKSTERLIIPKEVFIQLGTRPHPWLD